MVDVTEDPRYLQGMEQFHRGNYFRCHEIWEAIWRETSDAPRQFFRGLIQASVALHHAGNGNVAGALKLLTTSEHYLAAFRPRHGGLDVDGFLALVRRGVHNRLKSSLARAEAGGAAKTAARSTETPRSAGEPLGREHEGGLS